MSDNETLSDYVDRQIKSRPIEARIIRKVIRGLKDCGTPVVDVWDGEQHNPVKTERDILEQVFNLDEAWLYTERGSMVFLTMGEEWGIICDWSISLDPAIDPVMEYINKHI